MAQIAVQGVGVGLNSGEQHLVRLCRSDSHEGINKLPIVNRCTMQKTTIDHIKLLTKLDTKTLSERVVKLFEEGGELAKKVAPYENVSSTRHRFIEKNSILEESVDCMLVAYSIAYHLGYDDTDIEEMFKHKLIKWDGLLEKEKRTAGKPIPYEIHITVCISDTNIQLFRDDCVKMGIKPIVLDLQIGDSGTMQDVMTSSVVLGDNRKAYEEACSIADQLEEYYGHRVVRKKIETVPWHPASPQELGDVMPPDCYFESHVAVVCTDANKKMIATLAKQHDAHMSRNIFKPIDDTSYVQMLTLRWYSGIYSNFESVVDAFIAELKENNILVEKKIVEFSVYDTKVTHDASWISK